MKIFSLIPFWTIAETSVLLAKLKLENSVVDNWLVLESCKTHAGKNKEYIFDSVFDRDLPNQYKDKIIYLKSKSNKPDNLSLYELFPEYQPNTNNLKAKINEFLQLLPLIEYCKNFNEFSLILSDCDELIDFSCESGQKLAEVLYDFKGKTSFSLQKLIFEGNSLNLSRKLRALNIIGSKDFLSNSLYLLAHGRGLGFYPFVKNKCVAIEFSSCLNREDFKNKYRNTTHYAKFSKVTECSSRFLLDYSMAILLNSAFTDSTDKRYPDNIKDFKSLQNLDTIGDFSPELIDICQSIGGSGWSTDYLYWRKKFGINTHDFSIMDMKMSGQKWLRDIYCQAYRESFGIYHV